MFRGTTTTSLDAKGRMGLPARVREGLMEVSGADLVVTIDTQERCLLLYPLAQWEVIQTKLQELANVRSDVRSLQRLLIGHATDLQIDGSGRVLLPAMLREFAGLEKSAVLVGLGKKFEVWSETNWHTQREHWLVSRKEELSQASEAVLAISL